MSFLRGRFHKKACSLGEGQEGVDFGTLTAHRTGLARLEDRLREDRVLVFRTRPTVYSPTPYLDGASSVIRWSETRFVSPERCASSWASSRDGAFCHRPSVDAAVAV